MARVVVRLRAAAGGMALGDIRQLARVMLINSGKCTNPLLMSSALSRSVGEVERLLAKVEVAALAARHGPRLRGAAVLGQNAPQHVQDLSRYRRVALGKFGIDPPLVGEIGGLMEPIEEARCSG